MSRPLVALAALVLAVAGLLPVGAMLLRLRPVDFPKILDPESLDLFANTLLLGLTSAGVALLLGAPFGFLVARTDMPGRRWLRPLGVVPLFLPPLMIAMTWTAVTPLRGTWMAALVLGAGTFPLVAVFTARAFERIDARLEEAALLAGGLPALLRADLGLVLPPALCGACLALVFAVNDFSVPDYVASVGAARFDVYSDRVFAACKQPVTPGYPVARALPLIAFTLAALLPALALRRRGAMASLAAHFRQPGTLRLGTWRWPAFAFCLAVVLAGAGVPLLRFLWEMGGGHKPAGFATASFGEAWSRALELARGDLQNSLVYAVCTATIAVPLALVIGHALERARRGRWLEPLALLPMAMPAVLFGIGYIAIWNHDLTARFYDGGGLVVLLMIGRFLPFPVLILSGAVASLDPRLEEAGDLAGARPARRLASIVAPSLRSTLIASWVLVFVLALRELDAAILVPAANHTAMVRIYHSVHFGRDEHVAALSLLLAFFILLPGLLWAAFGRRRLEVLP